MTEKTMFEDAQNGDRVWDFNLGWGSINNVATDTKSFAVVFDLRGIRRFNFGGVMRDNNHQTLFWDEIKFDIPPRPKRKVKKVIEGWVNVYELCLSAKVFKTCEEAKDNISARGCLGQHHIVFEYEEDE